jgi:hypothetical protein
MLPSDANEGLLRELCNQRWPESQTLDFKRSLPGTGDRDKSEFLKDVCAFANASGGDLLYGVVEEGGTAKELSPIAVEAADAAKRRLGQVIDAGLEPRVAGLRMQQVPVSGGYVLAVRVPASFNGPHRYIVNNVGRFVMRNGTHTVELTYEQLRTAFDRTATLGERARRFRMDRLQAITDGDTPKRLPRGPVCVTHLIPIVAMAGTHSVDIQTLYDQFMPYIFNDWGGASRATNLDGLVVHPLSIHDGAYLAYTQIFRSGAFEAVRFGAAMLAPEERKIIPSSTVSQFFRHAIRMFLDESLKLGLAGPAIVGVALLSVADYEFGLGQQFFRFNRAEADRDNLIVPASWLNDIGAAQDLDVVARPLLDVMWQAFGVRSCHEYDDQGRWKPR